MNVAAPSGARSTALSRLRAATQEAHKGLDRHMDAVSRLADVSSRDRLVRSYADFHIPADGVFAAWLGHMPDLDLAERSRGPLLGRFAVGRILPDFPRPRSPWSALGMLYVTEGSALGGRMILRELEKIGVSDPDLGFLDPYGSATSGLWRGFLSVLERETGEDDLRIDEACAGAVAAFVHAERVLCEVARA